MKKVLKFSFIVTFVLVTVFCGNYTNIFAQNTTNEATTNDEQTKIEFKDPYVKEILLKLFKEKKSYSSEKYGIKLSEDYTMPADQDFITVKEAKLVEKLSLTNKFVFNEETKKFDRTYKNITSIEGLEHFTNLTELFLMFNDISDITPIQNLTSIKSLNIANNKISNIDFISKFTELTNFTFDNNKVSDLTPIKDLKNLEYLNFKNNLISDLTPIKNTPVKSFITVYGNYIKDLSVLKDFTAKKEAYSEYVFLEPDTNTFELDLKDIKGGEDYYLSDEALAKINAVRIPNTKKYKFTAQPTQSLEKERIETEILGDLFASSPTMKNLWLVWVNTENVKLPKAKEEIVELNGTIDLSDNIENLFDVEKVEQISESIDTSVPGNYEATMKITYNYGLTEEIKIPVTVLKPASEEEDNSSTDNNNNAEDNSETKPENRPESKPENKPENKPESKPENKPESKLESNSENKSEGKLENNSKRKSENKLENNTSKDKNNKKDKKSSNIGQKDNIKIVNKNIKKELNKNPKTGDTGIIATLIILAISAAYLIILSKNKKYIVK